MCGSCDHTNQAERTEHPTAFALGANSQQPGTDRYLDEPTYQKDEPTYEEMDTVGIRNGTI